MTILEAAKEFIEADAIDWGALTHDEWERRYAVMDAARRRFEDCFPTDRKSTEILARLLVRGVVTEAQIADAARSET